MATSNNIQSTLNWCAAYILNRPSAGVATFTNEPALTNANLIMSTILAPPFAWQWNRTVKTFSTQVGISDYFISLPDFGWLEKVTIYYAGMSPSTIEIQISNILSASGKQNRPFEICPVFDDNNGNITFRLLPIPDQVYVVTLTYQKAPIFAASLQATWAPIPDKYNFLYERGMLAHLHGMYDASTYLSEMQLFFRQLIGCSEGLSDTAKFIFLEDRMAQVRTEATTMAAISGSPKRGQ